MRKLTKAWFFLDTGGKENGKKQSKLYKQNARRKGCSDGKGKRKEKWTGNATEKPYTRHYKKNRELLDLKIFFVILHWWYCLDWLQTIDSHQTSIFLSCKNENGKFLRRKFFWNSVTQRSIPSFSYLFEVCENHAGFSRSRTKTTFSVLTTWLHV